MSEISFFNKTFWDLVLMKLVRNIASVKYQWLTLLYIPTIYGMFNICEKTGLPWISDKVGLGFLGAGFITLATSRLVANTKLIEDNKDLDTDK